MKCKTDDRPLFLASETILVDDEKMGSAQCSTALSQHVLFTNELSKGNLAACVIFV